MAGVFAALSEPSRLGLLQALREGPRTVGELVEATGMKQPNVSKHLGLLHQRGLVKRRREGICIRYEVRDPMVFALCELACGKAGQDVELAVRVFNPAS